jgi:hypothetical protein
MHAQMAVVGSHRLDRRPGIPQPACAREHYAGAIQTRGWAAKRCYRSALVASSLASGWRRAAASGQRRHGNDRGTVAGWSTRCGMSGRGGIHPLGTSPDRKDLISRCVHQSWRGKATRDGVAARGPRGWSRCVGYRSDGLRRRRFMRRKPRMGWEVRREVIPGAILGHCRVGNRKRSSLTPAFPSTRVDFRTPLQASPSVPMRSTVRVTARLSRDLLPGALFHATFRFRFR